MTKTTELKSRLAEITDLHRAAGVLSWDHETYMPPGGLGTRAEQLSTLEKLAHELFTREEIGALIETATAECAPDSDDAVIVRLAKRDYDKARKLPTALVARLARETALAHDVWVQARRESNFAKFAPSLQTIVALTIEKADALGHNGCRYDALLDNYEQGMKTAAVRDIFTQLKAATVPLIQAISERLEAVDDSPLRRDYDEARQLALGESVARQFGFDFTRGRQDKSVHPFCAGFSPGDVRITTRVGRNELAMALMGTMHETGHALYEQGLPVEFDRTPLCNSTSLGVHESQSRMWENLVGRSRAFWRYFFPQLRAAFPETITDADSSETFYRAVNKVMPSLIRVEADELTYNFHILLRFELEDDLLEGRLAVADLPAAWNAKMQTYLGINPPTDALGVLQDIHWSGGSIGYFPTYTLGNLIGAQLAETILVALPDLDAQFERGEFGPLLDWLRTNIHRHGRRYEPAALVERVTGRPISAEAFVRYAKQKFGELYGLN